MSVAPCHGRRPGNHIVVAPGDGRTLQLQPIGVPGELLVGGACVAPEFFKSWLSRPGADLSRHVLHGSLESGKLAASVRASLGGVGPAPPLNPNPNPQNNVAASIPTASKANSSPSPRVVATR